jgi:hypothetical protein
MITTRLSTIFAAIREGSLLDQLDGGESGEEFNVDALRLVLPIVMLSAFDVPSCPSGTTQLQTTAADDRLVLKK